VIVNCAGLAHVDRETPDAVSRLHAANVELPLTIAAAALKVGASMVHVSSAKAASPSESAYAASKHEGEVALEHDFGDAFVEAGKALVILRPLALLFPPLDAGKVRHLRFLRHVPARLVPGIRLPVLTTETFERTVGSIVADLLSEQPAIGYSIREFSTAHRGTLRDIASAFRTPNSRGVGS
jgi:nucleoside-diphosphate-sugar epimerase